MKSAAGWPLEQAANAINTASSAVIRSGLRRKSEGNRNGTPAMRGTVSMSIFTGARTTNDGSGRLSFTLTRRLSELASEEARQQRADDRDPEAQITDSRVAGAGQQRAGDAGAQEPPAWLLNPMRPTPVALDSPEYSVLAATRTGNVMLNSPVPSAGDGHRCPESEVESEQQETATSPQYRAASDVNRTTPSVGNERCRVASDHLPDSGDCQRQRHEADAQPVGMDQVGGEIADHAPESDALRHIDRHRDTEKPQGHQRPVPGEKYPVANSLPSGFRESRASLPAAPPPASGRRR